MSIAGPPTTPPAFVALNELAETYLASADRREARVYLRTLAARLTRPAPGAVVGLHEPANDTEEAKEVRAWLQERLSVWLAKYG